MTGGHTLSVTERAADRTAARPGCGRPQQSASWGWHRLDPEVAERLVDGAGLRAGALVLDIGAGDGVITDQLLRAGCRVVAIELHPDRVALLRRRFADRVTVVRADAADLRLPRRPFHDADAPARDSGLQPRELAHEAAAQMSGATADLGKNREILLRACSGRVRRRPCGMPDITITDAELVAAHLEGRPDALAAIYDRYGAQLYDTAAAMLSDRHEAADVAQDVFVVAAERMDELRDPTRLRAWMFAILRNEVYRRTRRRKRSVPTDFTAPGADMAAPDDQDVADEAVDHDDMAELVRAAAAGLDARDQLVLELSVRQELQGAELADALGVSAQQCYGLVHRMRERTERSLTAYCVARAGRKDCDELSAILSGWDGQFTVLIRKRVARHIDGCDTCDRSRKKIAPVALLRSAPVLAAPPDLRDRILSAASTGGTTTSTTRFDGPDGFPGRAGPPRRLLQALALVVAVLLITAVTLMATARSADAPESGMLTATTAGDDADAAGDVDGADTDGDAEAASGEDQDDDDGDPDGDVDANGDGTDDPSTGAGDAEAEADADGASIRPVASTVPAADPGSSGAGPAPTTAPSSPGAEPAPTTTVPTTTVPSTPAPPTTTPPTTTPPAPGALATSVDALDFGATATTRTLTLSNPGGQSVVWSVGGGAAPFSVQPASGTLAADASTQVTVSLDRIPVPEGAVTGTATFQADGVAPQAVSLTGEVRRPPVVTGVSSPPSPSCLETSITFATVSATITDEQPAAAVLQWTGPAGQNGSTPMSGAPASATFSLDGTMAEQVGVWNWTIVATDSLDNVTQVPGTFIAQTC